MLTHYWTAADSSSARQAQIEDWITDLVEFGPLIVNEACERWRRQPGGKRPTPGDIRAYCIEEQRDRREHQLAIESRSPRWDPWLYELWGPASTGIPKREAAQREREASLRRAEDWRASEAKTGAVSGFKTAAQALGVRVREYTPEEMSEGRRELGLEEGETTA